MRNAATNYLLLSTYTDDKKASKKNIIISLIYSNIATNKLSPTFTTFRQAMEIGVVLRRLRDKKRISSRDAAERIGVTQSTYLDWEHDKSSPTIKMFFQIAKTFEICPIDLMSHIVEKNDLHARQHTEASQLTELVKNIQQYLSRQNGEGTIKLRQNF